MSYDSGPDTGHEGGAADPAANGLRRLLNEWDPLGVADDVQDEYDCMLALLLQQLREGADQAAIGEYLRQGLEDHFGVDPMGLRPEAMAHRVVSWWVAAMAGDTGR
ncbi:hypothetical protein AB0M10_28680 [Streptomyces sp. NPDC051840]|uniref:hypothetical protein n=1 Tax=unclassified Streptomyces TaxID=2593676 RepID=UPI00342DE922